MTEDATHPRALLTAALDDDAVQEAAKALRQEGQGLPETLALGRALARACNASEVGDRLSAELSGYQTSELEIPEVRRVMGFASPFPVRALDQGVLLPEEIFLANREKFSQVTLTIGQPIAELESALAQIRQGGVLALRVPAREITGASADTEDDTEVYIYILPREIQKIVEAARAAALAAITDRLVEATLDEASPTVTTEEIAEADADAVADTSPPAKSEET